MLLRIPGHHQRLNSAPTRSLGETVVNLPLFVANVVARVLSQNSLAILCYERRFFRGTVLILISFTHLKGMLENVDELSSS